MDLAFNVISVSLAVLLPFLFNEEFEKRRKKICLKTLRVSLAFLLEVAGYLKQGAQRILLK